MMTFV